MMLWEPSYARAQFCQPNPNANGPPFVQNCPVSALGENIGMRAGYPFVTLSDVGTNSIKIDASTGNIFLLTLHQNDILQLPINLVSNSRGMFVFVFTQDNVGSRTISFASGYKKVVGGTYTLSTGAGAVDIMSCLVIGSSTVYCLPINQNFQ